MIKLREFNDYNFCYTDKRNHVGFALIKMCWFIYFLCVISVLEIPVPQRNKITSRPDIDSHNYNRNQVNVTSVPDCVSMFTVCLTGKLMLTLRTELLQ